MGIGSLCMLLQRQRLPLSQLMVSYLLCRYNIWSVFSSAPWGCIVSHKGALNSLKRGYPIVMASTDARVP